MATESKSQRMTEREQFQKQMEKECACTLRVLRALPADQGDFRPHPRSKSAKELAWMFTLEQGMVDRLLTSGLDFSQPMPPPPATLGDAIAAFEHSTAATRATVSKMSDEKLESIVEWPTGPGQMGKMRALDVMWFSLMDQVHHRGQLSVYVRMAGGKVPSIYGPTADEPWM